MSRLLSYLNPLARLGNSKYSVSFPLTINILLIILSEIYAYGVAKDPRAVGVYIIFVNVAFILYFAFRDAIRGGFISAIGAISYYFYIIYSRHYLGRELTAAVETTIVLGVLYFILAFIVGWLKQRIDRLIEREADEKRRLETIIQQLPVGILITNSEGKLVQRNSLLDDILGVSLPIGFMFGRDTLEGDEKINDRPINPSESPLFQALQSGKPVIGREFDYLRGDGKRLSLQVSSSPILNKMNKVIAAASIITDITEQKALEKQKDEFLGIASHELKTPVTSIKAYGEVLQSIFRRKGDTQAVVQLKKMDAQINKLTDLIEDLLDVTKIRSGKLEFHEDYFDLSSLIREIVEQLQLTTDKHDIVSEFGGVCRVYADRDRIGQVLINLISNAIKYSPVLDSSSGNRLKIIVKTRIENDSVVVSVQDFGVGIQKEIVGQVFDQFYRGSGPTQSTFPGLGLGLYISSEIMRREGGTIWVESEEKKGSTFYFSLPFAQS